MITPFTNYDNLILINLFFMIGIFVHWVANNNVCALTMLEKKLMGTEDDERTFFGRLFGKVYTFGKDEKETWYIMGLLILVSSIKVYNNDTLRLFIQCLQQSHKSL